MRLNAISHLRCAGSSYNLTQQALDCKKLATLKFTMAFPSHDHATGVQKEALEAFAAAL
jgi:hypothetical protein